ncbi:MAG: hypothetical protein N2045_04795 [Fimbriimonadales bacterium]|jgi:hypothetical protein|nr:hypothetical protein [Armatimonadota bacterium]MCX7687273.1 hypothetical protein [Fimbriimonadales bacterium]GBC91540.1 hypothetical protein HRbin14_02313 [bacterium HR14]CUU11046.1 hypothetical protein GBSOP10_10952 [Armatimonadetes bacterium GBS]
MRWRDQVLIVFFIPAVVLWVIAGVWFLSLMQFEPHPSSEATALILRVTAYLVVGGAVLLVIGTGLMLAPYWTRRWGRK